MALGISGDKLQDLRLCFLPHRKHCSSHSFMSKAVQKLTVAASQVGCDVSDIPGPSEDWAP